MKEDKVPTFQIIVGAPLKSQTKIHSNVLAVENTKFAIDGVSVDVQTANLKLKEITANECLKELLVECFGILMIFN